MKDVGKGFFLLTGNFDYYSSFSRYIRNDNVYIFFNFLLPSDKNNRIVDFLDNGRGKYIKSFMIHNLEDGQRADQTLALNDYFYVLCENTSIVKYKV
jgi:hypothetical protein